MKAKGPRTRKDKETPKLSNHEREQLHAWMKTTPQQRLAWLEEALQLAALHPEVPYPPGAGKAGETPRGRKELE